MKKILILLLFPCSFVVAQQDLGISLDEFALQVDGYLSPEQISTVRETLPVQCVVYGYSLGDYSGDSLPDLAISVRTKELRGKKMKIYYFVSDEEQFILVRENVLEFYDVPLEIGFTIENGLCYTMQKKGENNWTINGYCYRDGNFFLADSYESMHKRVKISAESELGYENTKNFRNLVTTEQLYSLASKKPYLKSEYFTFPAYPIDKNIRPYLYYVVRDTSRKFIVRGGENFSGRGDAGFETAVFYDDAFLYFFAWVDDDSIEIGSSDWDRIDHVQLWFDIGRSGKYSAGKTAVPGFRTLPDDSVFMVAAALSKTENDPQRVLINLRKDPSVVQQEALNAIRVQSNRTMNGYTLRIRIPFELFGGMERLRDPVGYTLVLHDIDGNDSTPRVTELATSAFSEWNPSTFGTLEVMRGNTSYGEVIDLNTAEMLRKLVQAGVDAL